MGQISRRNLFLGAACGVAFSSLSTFVFAQSTPNSDAFFVDSNAGQLSGVSKVIIANLVIEFQTETRITEQGGRFVNRNDTTATNKWENLDVAQLTEIADKVLANLKQSFREKNIEVIDESALANIAEYNEIIRTSGFDNGSYWGNNDGKSILISPQALKPYQEYSLELGNYASFGSLFGGGRSGNPPSNIKGQNWQTPGREIAIANALGAAVVKAHYIVNFSKLSAGASVETFNTTYQGVVVPLGNGLGYDTSYHSAGSVQFNASAGAFGRIKEEQSRLSFRLPTSAQRMGYRVSNYPVTKMAPPHDGDVVIAARIPFAIGSDIYNVSEGRENQGALGGLLGGTHANADAFSLRSPRGQARFDFSTNVSDYNLFKQRVGGTIVGMQSTLVATALGR